tara:strand:+ start:930 stop:1061 length:132 start_codon:yes stop_codon:yes gene_type:complete
MEFFAYTIFWSIVIFWGFTLMSKKIKRGFKAAGEKTDSASAKD